MEIPSWFHNAIQRRLDRVSAWVERQPEMHRQRMEEEKAFHALFAGSDLMQSSAFDEWEDKHHLTCALEQEQLYLQGMRDGVQACMRAADGSDPT